MRYVIAGCGAAGLHTALTIRESDPQGEIFIVTRELWPFYLKPVLSEFIANKTNISRMTFIESDKIEELNICMHTGKRIISIDPHASRLVFSDSSSLHYDKLCIATGAKPKCFGL